MSCARSLHVSASVKKTAGASELADGESMGRRAYFICKLRISCARSLHVSASVSAVQPDRGGGLSVIVIIMGRSFILFTLDFVIGVMVQSKVFVGQV